MGEDKVVYAGSKSCEDVNNIVIVGLSRWFDVESVGEFNSGLVNSLISREGRFGLVTHFPCSVEATSKLADSNNLYAGTAEMLRGLQVFKPDLPIVVYTGMGSVEGGTDVAGNYILGAGAHKVVFKGDDPEKDVVIIRKAMSELLKKI